MVKNGYKQTPEHIEKRITKTAAANKGRKHSPKAKAKMRVAKLGKKQTPDHIAKRTAKNTGQKRSEETKNKMRVSQIGENNHNWQGGISYEPYCVLFNNEFRERVRAFFDYKCVECGKYEVDNDGRKLSVHHVNFDKGSCCNKNIPLFVPLCTSCHGKTTHGNRDYWEERYTTLINEKYGGQCYLPKV